MKKAPASILGTAASLSLTLVVLLTALQLVAFNPGFYRAEYRKYDRPAAIGMSEPDLMKATGVLLDYARGKRPDMKVEATVNGQRRLVFDERETEHMVDVRVLFMKGFALRWWALALAATLALVLRLLAGGRGLAVLARSFVGVTAGWLVVFAGLVVLFNLNFTGFWDQFHYVFFSNNLWQLDPDTSIMINMFPEEFFYDIAVRVVTIFAGTLLVLGGAAWYYLRRSRHRRGGGRISPA
ncbi:MAG TPA: TIGR01906 family membrane protein [Bacillota bacterium]|jgi:integral membrane protein (TIGR01906 family)